MQVGGSQARPTGYLGERDKEYLATAGVGVGPPPAPKHLYYTPSRRCTTCKPATPTDSAAEAAVDLAKRVCQPSGSSESAAFDGVR